MGVGGGRIDMGPEHTSSSGCLCSACHRLKYCKLRRMNFFSAKSCLNYKTGSLEESFNTTLLLGKKRIFVTGKICFKRDTLQLGYNDLGY